MRTSANGAEINAVVRNKLDLIRALKMWSLCNPEPMS